MAMEKAFIPYGNYWSTPFTRWQGSLAEEHSIELAARVAKRFHADRDQSPSQYDGLVLGITVPQRQSFYGAPWLAGMIGAGSITGPTISQACATSVRVLATAAHQIEVGGRDCLLAVTCDRTSNGPHVYYPSPKSPGGRGRAEDPVLDNFGEDPYAGGAMIGTAENTARRVGISREQQDEMALLRHQQYQAALADDRAFQKRYMVPVELVRGKRVRAVVEADEGVHPTTAEGLAGLRPVQPDGTVTFGTQTHPADGAAALVVCGRERAERLATDPKIPIQILGFGEARVERGYMPMAVVPAACAALDDAGVAVGDCAAFKTHNPFAINDVFFCKETGIAPDKVNNYGSPLVWGHPQAPTGVRAVLELIEELAQAGGGVGLFSGCAAGDSAMAMVVRVG